MCRGANVFWQVGSSATLGVGTTFAGTILAGASVTVMTGATVTGRVLVMPSGRGSSSSSTVLAEAIRLGTGPAAVVLREPDGILALGSIAARHLYGVAVPVVIWNGSLPEGRVRVRARGTTVSIDPA